MTQDEQSVWTPDEERRVSRVMLAALLFFVASLLLGALWAIAPRPLRGGWLAAIVAAGVCEVLGVALVVWLAIQLKRRTGSYWPRNRNP